MFWAKAELKEGMEKLFCGKCNAEDHTRLMLDEKEQKNSVDRSIHSTWLG